MFDIFKHLKKDPDEVIPKSLVDVFVEVWNAHEEVRRKVNEHYINSGWCYQFALVVKMALGEKVELWSDFNGGHCWVKIGNMHYDAYVRTGKPQPLTIYSSIKGPLTEQEVINYWNNVGSSGPVQLDILKKVVAEWQQRFQPAS